MFGAFAGAGAAALGPKLAGVLSHSGHSYAGRTEEAMAAVAPGADARAMRARLSLAWAAVHGYCSLRAEGAGVGGFLARVVTSKPDFGGFGSLLRSGDEA